MYILYHSVSIAVFVVLPLLIVAVAVNIIIVVKAVISSSRPWLEPLALKLQHFHTAIGDDGIIKTGIALVHFNTIFGFKFREIRFVKLQFNDILE